MKKTNPYSTNRSYDRRRATRLLKSRVRAVFTFVGIAIIATLAKADAPPNIVLFLADDLGWTGVGCFGSDFYETPSIDSIAQQGMKFTNSYAACTVCSPTRASIMTGMYPARLRLTDFIAGQNRPFAKLKVPDWTPGLSTDRVTIAEALKTAGYRTAHIGKWHLSSNVNAAGTQPCDQGFDVSFDGPPGRKGYFLKKGSESRSGSNYLTDALTDRACDFVDESAAEPFFLYFAYHVPHTPIQGRQDLVEYFEAKVNKKLIHHNPTFAAMVKSLDQSVGRVLERLEANGLSQNTVVIFTSDNGGLTERYGKHDGFTDNLPLRRGKGSAYEGGVRVPTVIRWPAVIQSGKICETPIMSIDYFPTICELAGTTSKLDQADSIDGQSIVPLFRKPDTKFDRDLFWHYPHYHAGGDSPYSAIRSGDYRLIEFHEDNSLQLYNLADDLGEQHDLHLEMRDLAKDLRMRLVKWRADVQAQMPSSNPDFDPARQTKVAK